MQNYDGENSRKLATETRRCGEVGYNKINVTKRVVSMRREWNWLCIISPPSDGF